MMKRRIVTTALGALTAMAFAVGPAAAHPHSQAGFVGPNPEGPGGIAHNGIECAAANNPNITSLSEAFTCPAR